MQKDPEFLHTSLVMLRIIRPFGYERVYLPLYKVANTPFHIQGDELLGFTEGFNQ